jgi:formate hydrogenlyase subunit 4
MSALVSLFAQILHMALLLLATPVVAGVMDWLDARLLGRSPPPVLLPWRDLVRLSRKTSVVPESASRVLTFAPAFALGTTLCVAALVPSFTLGTAFAPLADGLVVAGLLSVARVAVTLGALDTGNAASGMAAQHASALAVLTEPALLLLVFGLALMGGSFNLNLIIGQQHDGMLLPAAASALALTSLLALVFADISDTPAGLDLDYSGFNLAIFRITTWLRRLVWIDLIAALFLPIGIAEPDGSLWDWGVGLLSWLAKLAAAVICRSVVHAMLGRVAKRDLPNLIGIAALLALLATIMVLASSAVA